MKTKFQTLPGAVLALLVLTLPANAATQVYDLNADWSDTANPNGPWSYRAGPTIMHSQMDSPHVSPGQPVWVGPGEYLPICLKYIGMDYYDIRKGSVYFHSANDDSEGIANILWTAAAAGTVNMSGGVWFAADDG